MLPGQLYLRKFLLSPTKLGKGTDWVILHITKVSRHAVYYHKVTGRRNKTPGYRMVTFEVIAKSKGYCGPGLDPSSGSMSSDSIAATIECKRLAWKDLPLYLDGDVTKKFEELLKRR